MQKLSEWLTLRFPSKAEGPNQNLIDEIDPDLIRRAVEEVGAPDTWPLASRDHHHILKQGRSLILRTHHHRDNPWRKNYPAVNEIVARVAQLGFGAVAGKIVIAYLPPGAVIKPHRDSGEYYKYHNRIHVPLLTNQNVTMTTDDEEFHMATGKVYLFQNLKRHAARNASTEGRLHLILDMLDTRYRPRLFRTLSPVFTTNALWLGTAYRLSCFLAARRQHSRA